MDLETTVNLMLTTGTVTMSLADVDALRTEIATHKDKVASLEKELQEVKADKRIVKITNSETIRTTINGREAAEYIADSLFRTGKYAYDRRTDYLRKEIEYALHMFRRTEKVPPSYTTDCVEDFYKTGKVEYINFEDVQAELRKQAEDAVSAELGSLKHQVSTNTQKMIELKKKHQDQIDRLTEEWMEKERQLQLELAEERKKYDDLLHERDTRTKEEQLLQEIKDLKYELEKERKRSWLDKLAGR